MFGNSASALVYCYMHQSTYMGSKKWALLQYEQINQKHAISAKVQKDTSKLIN